MKNENINDNSKNQNDTQGEKIIRLDNLNEYIGSTGDPSARAKGQTLDGSTTAYGATEGLDGGARSSTEPQKSEIAAVFDSGSGFTPESEFAATNDEAYKNTESILDYASGSDTAVSSAAYDGSVNSTEAVYGFDAAARAADFEEDTAAASSLADTIPNYDTATTNPVADTVPNYDTAAASFRDDSTVSDYDTPTDTGEPYAKEIPKVVFIIGASDGIGEKTAGLFASKGYTVYNGSRTACKTAGIRNITVDVVNDDTIYDAVAEIINSESKIDIFIYSAGFSLSAPVENTLEKDYRYLFDVNFFGFAKTVKAVTASMRKTGGGTIIAVSSMGGIFPVAFDAFYSASKAALNMFARSLSIELEPYNIKVVSVMPGGTATGFTRKRKVYPPDMTGIYEKQMMKANCALAEMEQSGMSPEKVAQAIAAAAEDDIPSGTRAVGLKNKVLAAADKVLPENITSAAIKNRYRQNGDM